MREREREREKHTYLNARTQRRELIKNTIQLHTITYKVNHTYRIYIFEHMHKRKRERKRERERKRAREREKERTGNLLRISRLNGSNLKMYHCIITEE